MKQAQHTATPLPFPQLPWTVNQGSETGVFDGEQISRLVYEILDSQGRQIAVTDKKRAAFIVRACNSHEALVQALKSSIIALRHSEKEMADEGAWARTIKQVEAALALAEKGE